MPYTISSDSPCSDFILHDSMTVLSGGLAENTTVDNGGWMNVSSGGTANNTTVYNGGWMNVFSGGTANEITENGGYVHVEDGANVTFASNTIQDLILDGTSASVHSGTTANNVIVSYGRLRVYSGGTADNTTVDNGGWMNVSSGGTANNTTISGGCLLIYDGGAANTTISGGCLLIYDGGTANNTTISGGSMYVSSGGTADNTTISGGELTIHSGGTADAITENGGYVHVEDGANVTFASNTIQDLILDGTSASVHSGTTANNVIVYGGQFHIHSGGTADNTTISGGNLTIFSGGTADAITENGGYVHVEDGANVTFASNTIQDLILDGTSASVHSGTTANNVIVYGGQFHIHSGGTADNTTISGGNLTIFSGGTADNTTVSGGWMNIFSGGTATNINWTPCEGHVFVSNGGYATFVSQYSGVYYGSDNHLLSSAATMDSISLDYPCEMNVMSGGTAHNTTISRGSMYVSSGGTADNTVINGWGGMRVSSGGTAHNTTISSGSLLIYDGTADNTTISSGSLLIYGGGAADNTTISGGSLLIYDGTADNTTISGGSLLIYDGGTADNTTVSGGWMNISSGGTADNTTVSGGWMNISSGGTADNTTISGGSLLIYDGGTADNTTVSTSDGCLLVYSGGAANNTTINGWGRMYVSSGGAANNTTISSGNLYVSSGGTADNTTISGGSLLIYNGGVADNTVINGWGKMYVSSGGVADNTTISSGYLYVSSGGTADNTTISGGELTILSGGAADNTTISGGSLLIYDGGTTDNTVISGGSLLIYGGVAANNTTIYGGELTILSGMTFNTVVSGGSLLIYDGAANNTTISGGSLLIYDGGAANNTTISGGELTILSGGGAANTTIYGGELTILSGGAANNTTIYGGALNVRSGGKVTGCFDCGNISFDSGAVLDFDIRGCGWENPEAIVKNLSSVPDGVCYSLTIMDDQTKGTYKLADGMTGFGGTISVFVRDYSSGGEFKQINALSLDRTEKINGENYTLRLNEGDLTLTIEPDNTVHQYIYLDFDGENNVRYRNQDLNLSFALSVQDPGISQDRRQAILSELSKKYEKDGIVFTLDRPVGVEYSTLFFGTTDAFDGYGEFYGVSETHDGNNQDKSDCAYVLLDQSYSDGQIVSVASHMLDHLMGYSYMADGTPALKKYAESTYLLSTEWSQRSPYNNFCPVDPDTGKRCVTGCNSTGATQIINYWIETGLLDLTLTLEDSDAYVSQRNSEITIDGSANPGAGHLSFSETNKLLANYIPGNSDSIAALCFAAGVILKTEYGSDGSAAKLSASIPLYNRSGLNGGKRYTSKYYFLPEHYITDEGLAILTKELIQGRPVGVTLHYGEGRSNGDAGHFVVIDGYNSANNEFHVNFGWGGKNNQWYSLNDLNEEFGIDGMVVGVSPIVSPDLQINSLSLSSVVVTQDEDITLHFTVSNAGKERSEETSAFVYCGETWLKSFNMGLITPGCTRDYVCTVNVSGLPVGENTITVEVDSQKDGGVSILSQTFKVYGENIISPDDDTWKLAAAEGRPVYAAQYDAEGVLTETILVDEGYVGTRDPVDYMRFMLDDAAKLSFLLNASDATKFTIFKLNAKTGKNGNVTYSLKSVQSTTLKKSKGETEYTEKTKSLLLDKGEYYFSVKSTNAAKGANADYSISLDPNKCIFYTEGDNSDDWTDMKTMGAGSAKLVDFGPVNAETGTLIENGWVGFGDTVDYRKITLESAAKLRFTLDAGAAAKFTVYRLISKTNKKGVTTYSLKALQTTALKKQGASGTYAAKSGELLLKSGEYYIAMKSSSAAKGDSAFYNVQLNSAASLFYTEADHSDDWNDMKTAGNESELFRDLGVIDGENDNLLTGWVGYGDAIGYGRFTLETDASLSFRLYAGDAAKFTVYRLNSKTNRKGVSTYSLKSLQTKKIKAGDTVPTKTLVLAAGDYYFSMESTNAKKGGNASYSVCVDSFNAASHDAASLVMPESDTQESVQDFLAAGINGEGSFSASEAAPAGLLLDDAPFRQDAGLLA